MHSALELRTHWRTLLATEFSTITSCLPPTKTSSSDTKMLTWLTISKITNNNQSWWSKECEPSWSSCTFKQVGPHSLLDSKADLPPTIWNQLDNSWTRIWHQNNPTQSNLAPRKRRQPSWIRMSSEVFRLATFHPRCCWSIWTQSWTKKWKSRRQTNVCRRWQPSSDLLISPSCSNREKPKQEKKKATNSVINMVISIRKEKTT